MLSLETKYEDFQYYVDSQFSSKEKYTILANYLFSLVETILARDEEDDLNKAIYQYNDLLDYNYVLEYLRYNPRDEVLLLAHSAHTLLFLNSMETK